MKHSSMLDLIILHKAEKKVYSRITSPGMGLGILVVPFSRVRKIPWYGCSFFVLCSFIANKHTVCYCFPIRTSELKKYIFSFALQNGIQVSVLHKFASGSKTFLQRILSEFVFYCKISEFLLRVLTIKPA